jgi:hypothetical protein
MSDTSDTSDTRHRWGDEELRALLRRGVPRDGLDHARSARLASVLLLATPTAGTMASRPPVGSFLLRGSHAFLLGLGIFAMGVGTGLALAHHDSPPLVSPNGPPKDAHPSIPPAGSALEGAPVVSPSIGPAFSESATDASVALEAKTASDGFKKSAGVSLRKLEAVDGGGSASSEDVDQAERIELEGGRAALARGDAAGALLSVARHEKAWPNGGLTEEREALRIRALLRAGRGAEAEERAKVFRRTFPNSVFQRSFPFGLDAG